MYLFFQCEGIDDFFLYFFSQKLFKRLGIVVQLGMIFFLQLTGCFYFVCFVIQYDQLSGFLEVYIDDTLYQDRLFSGLAGVDFTGVHSQDEWLFFFQLAIQGRIVHTQSTLTV